MTCLNGSAAMVKILSRKNISIIVSTKNARNTQKVSKLNINKRHACRNTFPKPINLKQKMKRNRKTFKYL
jgi:hypothetical protein